MPCVADRRRNHNSFPENDGLGWAIIVRHEQVAQFRQGADRRLDPAAIPHSGAQLGYDLGQGLVRSRTVRPASVQQMFARHRPPSLGDQHGQDVYRLGVQPQSASVNTHFATVEIDDRPANPQCLIFL